MSNLGISYNLAGRLEESLQLRETMQGVQQKIFEPGNSDVLGAMNNLAISNSKLDRFEEVI